MHRGFSLVELSIVLVILGLLTGGILGGQSLIRASELRSVSTDLTRYKTAMYSFRDKYFALPGDMPNATRFWGIAAGATGYDFTCWMSTTTNGTCNGDGNGVISGFTSNEPPRFYQHLARAGMVEGNYQGSITLAGGYACAIGMTCPRMRIGNNIAANIYYLDNSDPMSADAFRWMENYKNAFWVGGMSGSCFNGICEFLKPEELWNLDTKMDDGRPGYGDVQTHTPDTPSLSADCADSSTRETARYKLSHNAISCMMIYKSGL